jgi:hypothetical protein
MKIQPAGFAPPPSPCQVRLISVVKGPGPSASLWQGGDLSATLENEAVMTVENEAISVEDWALIAPSPEPPRRKITNRGWY